MWIAGSIKISVLVQAAISFDFVKAILRIISLFFSNRVVSSVLVTCEQNRLRYLRKNMKIFLNNKFTAIHRYSQLYVGKFFPQAVVVCSRYQIAGINKIEIIK